MKKPQKIKKLKKMQGNDHIPNLVKKTIISLPLTKPEPIKIPSIVKMLKKSFINITYYFKHQIRRIGGKMFLNSIYTPGNFIDLRCCRPHDFNCGCNFPNPPPCNHFSNYSPCCHNDFVITIPAPAIWFMAGFILNNIKR